ncbi:MAG: sulfotransferase [Planctomycetota bacterium]|jgi:hypothetical protein
MPPDFLCIGTQKAGTSWLYRNVKRHPNVWMPPVKEIHYFDGWPPLPLIASVFNPRTFVLRRTVLRRLVGRKKSHAWDVQWHLRFLLLPRTDQWYVSLFSPGKDQIAGDVTPTYATINAKRVAQVHALIPRAKLIYLLRNPLTQMWSQAAMRFRVWYQRDLDSIPEKSIKRYFDRKKRSGFLDYTGNLDTWLGCFPADQVHTAFFDQLVENPSDFLRAIYGFLELDLSDRFIPKTVHDKRNPGRYPLMPDRLACYLARQYYEQIEELHRRFDNRYTAEWLDLAKRCL